ncbi:hypothetical protein ARA02_06490 [Leuconostoc mesenteroides subsp. jonggajibkimchii]|uniref:CDP-alcohol phosphatidyltransferase family protein n=1 Tax=Leuconostoc mesenteroides TaxID=1245 RepID=UPI000903A634|nr:CDP-alcohol phosphatidyltransferase family protein [Leuconostoc mesenteroides]APE76989.1 hypothetical protein ARA02_06490 [Leuconostoc mesenteroides subsp. jonggajibkimchii]
MIIDELKKTMTPEKKLTAKNDLFAYYVGRPLSYYLTVPFLKLNWSPLSVTILSIFVVVISSILMMLSSWIFVWVGFVGFFIWNLLDGVDGNIARLKKVQSQIGSVWDAMSGYIAMYLFFFSSGVIAYNFSYHHSIIWVILGSLSGFFQILPRLIMHKYINSVPSNISIGLSDKKNYGLLKNIALNISSITGFPQPLLLIALILHSASYFVLIYFFINSLLMCFSIFKLFKGERDE